MRGCITQRNKNKKNCYSVIVAMKDPVTNKQKRKWYTVNGTKKEAEKFLTEKLREIDTGIFVDSKNMTISQYLEYWYNQCCLPNLSPMTYESYSKNIRLHIIPIIGNIKLSDLQPIHLQTLYSNRLEYGLSKTTVRYVHRILHSALEQAMKWQFVARNVADNVDPPKPDKYVATVLTAEQVSKLIQNSKTSSIYIPIMIAIYTGMRRGEILALKWSDINFDKKYIRISKELCKTNQGLIYQPPKTEKSNRCVAISDTLVQILTDLKQYQKNIKMQLKNQYIDNDLICCTEFGKEIDPDCMNPKFKRILKKLGLPIIRFHDLRHTHASLLLMQGIQAKPISERLGHSNIGITMDLYSHIFEDTNRAVADSFDNLISSTLANG